MEERHSEKMPYVLDLGTGNGHLLFSLLEALEERPDDLVDPSRLCGIDYSAASIALSRAIGSKRSDGCEQILFEAVDLRDAHQVAQLRSKANDGLGWDIVCDKGTVRPRSTYNSMMRYSMDPDSRLLYLLNLLMESSLLTSTSMRSRLLHGHRHRTSQVAFSSLRAVTLRRKSSSPHSAQLVRIICAHGIGFEVIHVVPTPTFQFVRAATTYPTGWSAGLHRDQPGIPARRSLIDHVMRRSSPQQRRMAARRCHAIACGPLCPASKCVTG